MEIVISENRVLNGEKAALHGAELIRKAISEKNEANIILATGASQFEMLASLVVQDIEWSKVRGFHLDEYIGIPETHPASFRKYLKERFADITHPIEFIYVNGSVDPEQECQRLGNIIGKHPIDVAFIGIGENGHLAFNDPPADFETNEPYLVVKLDDACRRQQMGEGWFPSISDVPERAISMSINQILKSKAIICCVPELRKAVAVRNTVMGDISPVVPASVLRRHNFACLYLDNDAASLI